MAMSASPTAAARLGVREFIADRENLPASVRQRFFGVLDQFEAFRPATRRSNWRILLFLTIAMALGCAMVDANLNGPDVFSWPGYLLFSLVPILNIRRQEEILALVDQEIEWRAYCVFLRPHIMAAYPGLLDRNLNVPMYDFERVVPRPRVLLREIFTHRGLDFWWSALIGTWLSMGLVIISRQVLDSPDRFLPLALGAAGFLLGPVVWAFAQAFLYRLAQHDASKFP